MALRFAVTSRTVHRTSYRWSSSSIQGREPKRHHSPPSSRMESSFNAVLPPEAVLVDHVCDDLSPLNPPPALNRVLSQQVLSARVAERAAERNSWPEFADGFPTASAFFRYTCTKYRDLVAFHQRHVPSDLDDVFPLHPVDWDALRKPQSRLQVTWVGHASLLIQMDGCNLLADPVFSRRCAPTQYAGPERYRPPAFTVDEMLKEQIDLHGILISHNHYDHLDYQSILDLTNAYPNVTIVVPLGLQSWFKKHVRSNLSIVQLDWHEHFQLSCTKIFAVPMCHWSNRVGWDRDKSLWCGFAIESAGCKFLFPGDTGWFRGLHDVGRRYGPFDMAAIPIGAYEPRELMQASHLNPEEAVEMMDAVGARQAVPIHWGCFPLTLEPIMEPRDRLIAAVQKANKDPSCFSPWLIGETVVSNANK